MKPREKHSYCALVTEKVIERLVIYCQLRTVKQLKSSVTRLAVLLPNLAESSNV